MSDDLKNRGEPDRSRINLTEVHEVRYWSQKFGVSAEALQAAVKAAGSQAKDVESHLKSAKN
ncbi:MAG: DUF3606 domain-containing protein [Cytophagales bacterium]|nr:DUF3606 domain-containing protein [Rhizobacter sp.]